MISLNSVNSLVNNELEGEDSYLNFLSQIASVPVSISRYNIEAGEFDAEEAVGSPKR